MLGKFSVNVLGEDLILDANRALFWPKRQLLVLADLHLGKSTHFRREGIGVPIGLFEKELMRMSELIQNYEPNTLLFLGDLFHSSLNQEWIHFVAWRQNYSHLRFLLTKGNHDILPKAHYENAGIDLEDFLVLEPFIFFHGDKDWLCAQNYPIVGHKHPAIRIKGKAKQSEILPCFIFGEDRATLPAFGKFTGKSLQTPCEGDRIFALTSSIIFDFSPR